MSGLIDKLMVIVVLGITYSIMKFFLKRKLIESEVIGRWISTDADDNDTSLEFTSGQEWRAILPGGRIVRGSWDYSDYKKSQDWERKVFYLNDDDGLIYRMDFNDDAEPENVRIVLFTESGERVKFKRLPEEECLF